MAARIASSRLWTSRTGSSSRCIQCVYSTSTNAPPSPILSQLRTDLKTAMRARDTQRLNVLRALLAEITNSSKTPSPIKDDMGLLTLLKKKIGTSKTAVEDFYKADRKDLVTKEQEQVDILEEYAAGVKTVDLEEVRRTIKTVIASIKVNSRKVTMGDVLKRTIGSGGAMEGQMVEKSEVARIVKEELAAEATA